MELEARIANREKGQFPVSIGTSLALEGAAGVLEDKEVSPAPLLRAQELWVNMRTLFRNLYGALDSELRLTVGPQHLVPAMLEELDHIREAVNTITGHRCKTTYYACSYASLPRKFPKALLRVPRTALQKTYHAIESETITQAIRLADEDIRQYDVDIGGSNARVFMLTHCPVDLLSARSFNELFLLESHTGAIKDRRQWHTKLTGGKDLVRIPFDRMTLQMFGDGGQHFMAMPIKIRKVILELAERYKWTQVTTKSKIIYSVRQCRDPALEALVLGLY